MKVLHVAEPTDGGVARCVALFAAYQRSLGWDATVLSPSSGWAAGPRPGPATLGETLRLRSLIREVDPDVVHLHSSKAGLAGRLALRGARPTLFQPHAWSFTAVEGAVRRATLAWERLGARWATRVVCVSEGERAVGVASGIDARYVVVPNGVDLRRFSPGSREAAREVLGLGDEPLVVCVGRLHRQKGQHFLLDALPDVRVALVGDGPDRESLAARGAWLVGETDDVAAWYRAADVVVQPSKWEGMALTLLEAMACGRPIVATDVPGTRELLPPEALVRYGDVEALRRKVLDRIGGSGEGGRNRAKAEADHDLDAQLAAIAAVTREVG